MYNYIPHPSNARQFSGIVALRIEEGAAGYGVYWMILELLRDAPSYRYSNNSAAIAFAINEKEAALVERVCHNYGLFDYDDDGCIFSPWLLEQMGEYDQRKAKLSAAGKKGAAKRFGTADNNNGQALASPSLEDGQAKAYNIMYPNVTKPNITSPKENGGSEWLDLLNNPGQKVDLGLVEYLCEHSHEGYNTGYIAQVCAHYGVGENVFNFICERSNNADLTSPLYKSFCALVKRIQAEKFTPKQPNAFFLKKLFE